MGTFRHKGQAYVVPDAVLTDYEPKAAPAAVDVVPRATEPAAPDIEAPAPAPEPRKKTSRKR